ncbi:MAG: hypothetical protein J7L98_07565 [Candidatus Verstraetearchaeota archaeon]|nr:hypothetical protein [Candidatus Verstraetearchaeota archaeon]
MSEEDRELELIKRKKLLELQRKLLMQKAEPKEERKEDPIEFLRGKLVNRGEEVLDAALSQFPEAAKFIARQLMLLYKAGRLREPIDGVTLYSLFHRLGIPVRLETRIRIVKDGKVMSLAERLRGED